MRSIFPILSLSVCSLILAASNEPFILAAGGALEGPVADAPSTWELDRDSALAQLETQPNDPYSINFTYVQLDGRLYAYAVDNRTNWVANIEKNALVRVRLQNKIYAARATRVTSSEELDNFASVWTGLSVFQRDPMQFEEVWLYRLEARFVSQQSTY